jgi:KUP system potassium uptake protein
MEIRATSAKEAGQIYVSLVNWLLMIGTIVIVLVFRTSDNLAAAYGIAVSGTMLITTALLYRLIRERWQWPLVVALPVTLLFAAIDATFLAANSMKIIEGGWLPLVIGGATTFLMISWRAGSMEVQTRMQEISIPFKDFLDTLDERLVARIPGTGVFLTRVSDQTSPILLHHVEHNHVLHEYVVLLTIVPTGRPTVPVHERLETADLGHGFYRLIAHVGFMQRPDIAAYMRGGARRGLEFCTGDVHYFVPHEMVRRRRHHSALSAPVWAAFSFMNRNALRLPDFFHLPPKKVLELGLQVDI